ncbi:MAG TPA: hypothetical protein GXX31_02755 [Methanothermobacter sp.]|uniref:KEOPS complex Pcc1-like subunit n=1 Tax=Methanothermobacter tenebrarum TaxID=680118 RepID=A0ABN6PBR8_9EURY|nr:KEOPS complex subunit Pcc1 [Methanothermobacter tenebrarum]MDD3454974.1 KEOPS complex subunit Pcc1 [Methanobacteriales archaeon]MDI6881375.1 KEOPS complex subunit Pcc1 [Methanothermobacter sp.]MDX9693295.1 KEOPS complex subunit Pcc1 [Methanothermobacter sp.]BDH79649.1 hypothetical protein MTTB_10280 [Methanothermobacter tenebrarum]HHW16290.1 hypothetical protein [Methanothermobacter sp.]
MKLQQIQGEFQIQLEDEKTAHIIWEAIKPEIENSPSTRSKMKIKLEDKTILLKIESRDSTAFRAAMNSTLRWIKLAYDIIKLEKGDRLWNFQKTSNTN